MSAPTRKNNVVYDWKNTYTGGTEHLSAADLIRKYNLQKYQGNISQLIRGKFKQCKGWTVQLIK